ncbi:MAG: YifB family Mg chelatase-like AAA ATPase [Spirochaetia bacterium]|nr:YifB family Mg chelatase-like AAA ATPase [Spirochaetota bacterium]MCX8096574.1 YifB family Mg chelatase-like AAA ATPase [Spirochaetota bacterium]MDW8112872.1 YifB family Mg chelatase-like AAA ATPase [Spirochaetia bacterium]
MVNRVYSASLVGLNVSLVEVEVGIETKVPSFDIVGLPDATVKESKERVRSAIINSGFSFPMKRILINLAPAYVRKEGSILDLSIAVGILIGSEQINDIGLIDINNTLFVGELALDGEVKHTKGVLPVLLFAIENGFKNVFVPEANRNECSVVGDFLNIFPIRNLKEVVEFLSGNYTIVPVKGDDGFKKNGHFEVDFSDVKGQYAAKRAIEIAVSGGHNILMLGGPGGGKTMLARRIPTIMPEMSMKEVIETTKVYSIAGLLGEEGIVNERPFRSPHHTASDVSIIGGGRIPKPGEVSLAHNGVLFFDELQEFKSNVLQVMRQPLEEGFITISRAEGSVVFPANFVFVGAMNIAKDNTDSVYSSSDILRILNKISTPFIDRIDMHIEVPRVKFNEISDKSNSNYNSEYYRERVLKAIEIQKKRFSTLNLNITTNSKIPPTYIDEVCKVSDSSKKLLELVMSKFKISMRSYHKILKIARTIADIDGSEDIKDNHVAEAIQYRVLDKLVYA